MPTYRLSREELQDGIHNTPPEAGVAAAGMAAAATGGVETFRSIPYNELPPDIVRQLKKDGMRDGQQRTDAEAQAVYDQLVPAEAKGDLDAIRAITNDPDIHWGHIEPHSQGGNYTAENGVYQDGNVNQQIGARTLTEAEIADAQAMTGEIAESMSPGTTGDIGSILGNTAEVAAAGGVLGAGLGVAHRVAQAQGFRDAGREDLAQEAEKKIAADAVGGAVNASVRGLSMSAVQAVAGANPLTAGIGLCGPEIVGLVKDHEKMSDAEKTEKVLSISGKCAFASVLVAAGPVGWAGLGALSLWSAYSSGKKAGSTLSQLQGNA